MQHTVHLTTEHALRRVDVAVVGGGLAGLAAGATAARAGARVAVVDARSLGGRARTVARDGYALNEGAHALYRGAGGWAVLESLGVHPRGATPRTDTYRVVWDGEVAPLPTSARSVLSSRLLGLRAKRKLATWFADVARTAESAPDHLTFDAWLADRGAPPDLRRYMATMGRLVTYAADPGGLPARVVLGQFAAGGVAYLDGGWQQLVDGLAAAARRAGATLFERAPVTALVASDGGWTVVTPEQDVVAGAVVLAAGGPRVAAALLGADPAGWVERAGPVQRAACLDAGGAPGDVDFLLSADAPLYLSAHAPVAALAPEGQTLVSLLRYLAPDDPLTASENRIALERHASRAGLPDSRAFARFLAAPTVAWGSPQVGVERPDGHELSDQGVFAAGDWVGTRLLADAALVSGAAAGVAAARRAMVAA